MNEIDELTFRTRRREFEDGLFDLAMGLVFIAFSIPCAILFTDTGMYRLTAGLIFDRTGTLLLLLLVYLLMLVTPWLTRRAITYLRRKFIWSDAGFTTPLPRAVSWKMTLLSALANVLVVIGGAAGWYGGLLTDEMALSLLPAAAGLSTVILLLALASEMDLPRYRWVAVSGLILSILIPILKVGNGTTWLIFGLGWMALLLVSGLSALIPVLKTRQEHAHG